MTTPDCTTHGLLILDFFRGALDDGDALRAEEILSECPECRTWADCQFTGPAFDTVDRAVATGIENVAFSGRNYRFGWIAVAAAIVVMAGGLTMMQLPGTSTQMMPGLQDQTQSTRIGSFDFEGGAIGQSALQDENELDAAEAEPLFSDDLEDGIAGSWTMHT